MTDHVEMQEAIAAYVLDTLPPPQRSALEADLLGHLPGCASCATLLHDLREVSGDLALATGERELSEMTDARVFQTVTGPSRGAPARRSPVRVLVAAAVAVALVASVSLNVVLSASNRRADQRSRAIAAAAVIIANPEARTVALTGAGGSLAFTYLPSGQGALVGHGIATPSGKNVYELWLALDARYVPVTVFRPDDGDVVVTFSAAPERYAAAAITIEARRVPQPTKTPVFSATLSA